jgi:hypothetical protein
MKKENKEELNQLLARFYDQAEAREAAEDIEAGERIFNSSPAPEPAEAVRWRIKAAMAKAARDKRKISVHRNVYRVLAAAAVIIIMLSVSTRIIDNGSGTIQPTITPMVVVDTGAGGMMDAKAIILADEIDQAENRLRAIELGRTSDRELVGVDELESDYITIASDFWKGE